MATCLGGRLEWGDVEVQISHLFFLSWSCGLVSQGQMSYLSRFLMWFGSCSSLRINLDESELFPLGCSYLLFSLFVVS